MAATLGVRTETLANWERGLGRPLVRYHPGIARFLGSETEAPDESTLAGRLWAARLRLGLTQAELAARLGQDEHQICRWEGGRQKPHPWIAGRIDLSLRSLEGRPVEDGPQLTFFDLTRWRRKPPTGLALEPRTFGDWLRASRLRLNISMHSLAQKIGASRGTIYRLERGTQTPSDGLREKIGQVLASTMAEERT